MLIERLRLSMRKPSPNGEPVGNRGVYIFGSERLVMSIYILILLKRNSNLIPASVKTRENILRNFHDAFYKTRALL